jgi:tRNA 2-thiouridine synthesizing protein B
LPDVFVLTKPPASPRTELCLKLIERSSDAKLYLIGDGVYNILGKAVHLLPADKIYACQEDMLARGVVPRDVTVPDEFYELMVKAVMDADHAYSF